MAGDNPGPLSGETILDADPRFRFAWHRPPSGGVGRPLLVAVHGSDRDYRGTLAAFASLADRRDVSILAPFFPAGAVNAGVDGGYKFLREPGADYISLCDAMLAAFSEIAPFDARRLFLFGFSGGAQFALRYALVEASRLAGLIVAAPGNVTLLDDALPWWAGTGGIDRALGRPLDRSALRDLPVHLHRRRGRPYRRRGGARPRRPILLAAFRARRADAKGPHRGLAATASRPPGSGRRSRSWTASRTILSQSRRPLRHASIGCFSGPAEAASPAYTADRPAVLEARASFDPRVARNPLPLQGEKRAR